MEPTSKQPPMRQSPHNRNLGGLVLILIGVVFLLKKIPGVHDWIPYWVFTWPSILIVIGLFIGIKSRFKSIAPFILIGLGLFFLLEQASLIATNFRPYIWPIALILLGIVVLSRRNNPNACRGRARYRHHRPFPVEPLNPQIDSDDLLEVNSVFGNIERSLISKNFKGGSISATFGGAEVNLSKCDFQNTITLDISVIFGGVELVVPANWQIKNEVNAIMGGIEDKRNLTSIDDQPGKILILRGSVIFGGLELKSF